MDLFVRPNRPGRCLLLAHMCGEWPDLFSDERVRALSTSGPPMHTKKADGRYS